MATLTWTVSVRLKRRTALRLRELAARESRDPSTLARLVLDLYADVGDRVAAFTDFERIVREALAAPPADPETEPDAT